MFEWSEEQLMIRQAVRQFIEAEIAPRREELEFGDLPPYDILRKLFGTFGLDAMAREQFKVRIEREKRIAAGEEEPKAKGEADMVRDPTAVAMGMLPIIELCRYCPGMVTAMGVSMGLTSAAIMSRGTITQRERWARPLLTLEKIGTWAITEPDSGSDAFGGMRSSAVRDGDTFVLNGSKTFITNGPYADTTVFICKLDDDSTAPRERRVLSFILDRGMSGFEQSPPLRKMGLHSSPTGQLFLADVKVGMDRLIGGGSSLADGRAADTATAGKDAANTRRSREAARAAFASERASIAAMALGIVEQCLEVAVDYARTRVSSAVRSVTSSSSRTSSP